MIRSFHFLRFSNSPVPYSKRTKNRFLQSKDIILLLAAIAAVTRHPCWTHFTHILIVNCYVCHAGRWSLYLGFILYDSFSRAWISLSRRVWSRSWTRTVLRERQPDTNADPWTADCAGSSSWHEDNDVELCQELRHDRRRFFCSGMHDRERKRGLIHVDLFVFLSSFLRSVFDTFGLIPSNILSCSTVARVTSWTVHMLEESLAASSDYEVRMREWSVTLFCVNFLQPDHVLMCTLVLVTEPLRLA